MKAKQVSAQGEKTMVLIFGHGDEVISTLQQFASENHLDAAHFTAIGGFSDIVLGYFDRERKEYKKIPLQQQVEVLTLAGDIALKRERLFHKGKSV